MITREKRYGAYIGVLIGFFVWLVLLSLSGCTTYDVIQVRSDNSRTEVHIRSWRSFEDVALKYSRDGEIVGFEFGAASVVSQTPIDAALKGIEMGISIATGRPVVSQDGE